MVPGNSMMQWGEFFLNLSEQIQAENVQKLLQYCFLIQDILLLKKYFSILPSVFNAFKCIYQVSDSIIYLVLHKQVLYVNKL